MRTTLDTEDDVLLAANELARRGGTTAGRVISHLTTRLPERTAGRAIAERLAVATATRHHAFWADAVSILESGRIAWNAVLGSRQVSDVYLLALVVQQGGCPVMLDRAVSLQAVSEAKSHHLVVI